MGTLFKIYTNALRKYPLITSSIQTGALMVSGDVIAQTLIEGTSFKNLNLVRTTQFGIVGLCFVGPTLTTWYRFLDKRIGSKGSAVVLKKLALDQGALTPIFIVLFLTVLGTVQRHNFEFTVNEIKRNYTDILINNYKLWPGVQLINFYLVPLQYQILLVQVVALIWNIYLSWKTQNSSSD
ncbi:hypothetical protein FQR65_LT02566 [Abscondita terminalis]|nr:hypothetical protein FQR65_LT02566 [Abscondita terminalis]